MNKKVVHDWLRHQTQEQLVALLMEQTEENESLRQRLFLTAGLASTTPDTRKLERDMDATLTIGGPVAYLDMPRFAQEARDIAQALEDLLADGHGHQVIPLSERALAKLEKCMALLDDADGEVGDLLERLQDLHLAACVEVRPEPLGLARRLFEWELKTEWDLFWNAAETYAEVLGERGLALYRQLAERAWANCKPLGPGQEGRLSRHHRRFRMSRIMECLAEQSGDLEALVAVKRKDLSSPYRYLQIASLYAQADQPGAAIRWAEEGLAVFDPPDTRLQDFLAEQYHQQGRSGEALALIWHQFTHRPGFPAYEKLRRHAQRGNVWPTWRSEALDWIRAQISRRRQEARPKLSLEACLFLDHSLLVAILLDEGEPEQAWVEAQRGGCRTELWMRLAHHREIQHPEQAVATYQRLLPLILEAAGPEAHLQARDILSRIKELLDNSGQEPQFQGYLTSLRARYRLKRNFLALLRDL